METFSAPGLLVLVIAAALVVFTRGGRIIAGLAIAVGLLFASWNTFVETTECQTTWNDCLIDLEQPAWSGFCISSGSAGILKMDGRYVLAAKAGTDASATCLDLRWWR